MLLAALFVRSFIPSGKMHQSVYLFRIFTNYINFFHISIFIILKTIVIVNTKSEKINRIFIQKIMHLYSIFFFEKPEKSCNIKKEVL